jgi:hypothetical protein
VSEADKHRVLNAPRLGAEPHSVARPLTGRPLGAAPVSFERTVVERDSQVVETKIVTPAKKGIS